MIRIPKPFDSRAKREPLGCTGVRSVDLVCTQDGVNGGGTVTGAGAGFARARGRNRGAVREAAPVKVGFVRAGVEYCRSVGCRDSVDTRICLHPVRRSECETQDTACAFVRFNHVCLPFRREKRAKRSFRFLFRVNVCDNVRMISSQRQHLILSRLRTRGAVRITALSKELGVSAMTIRRDIADLADKGLLKRVHGGAVTTSTLLSEPLFSVKSQMDIGLKDAIAQEAVKYVAPGDVIAIGGGTTAYVFAQHLLESQQSSGITILTNSIPVAELVQALESKDVEVIVTGGVTTRSNSLVGPIADKMVASLRVNTVFLGTHSVSIPRGFLMPNSLEAATDMALMDIADRTIILTDHTKWSCTSLSLFARFDQVDTVITDDGLDPDSVGKTRDLVKELVLAHQTEQMQESE